MFKNNIEDPHLLAFASSLGITVSDTEHFFHLLTDGGAEELDIETFVQGCIRIKGYALSIDVQDATMKIARCNKGIQDLKRELKHVVRQMKGLETLMMQPSGDLRYGNSNLAGRSLPNLLQHNTRNVMLKKDSGIAVCLDAAKSANSQCSIWL